MLSSRLAYEQGVGCAVAKANTTQLATSLPYCAEVQSRRLNKARCVSGGRRPAEHLEGGVAAEVQVGAEVAVRAYDVAQHERPARLLQCMHN